jgi:hypothetical protein
LIGDGIVALSEVAICGSAAGRRVTWIKAAESLAQLVKKFDGRPGATFAQRLVYPG